MPPTRSTLSALIAAVLLAACIHGDDDRADNASGEVALERFRSTVSTGQEAATAPELADLAAGLEALALNSTKADDSERSLFSIYDLGATLALVGLGADGNSALEVAGVLGLHFGQAYWPRAFQTMDATLATAGITIAARGWGQSGYRFRRDYLESLSGPFDIELEAVDFRGASDLESWQMHGDWASAMLEDALDQLLRPSGPSASSRLLVGRTLRASFTPPAGSRIDSGTFNGTNGLQYELPMVHFTGQLHGFAGIDFDAAEWSEPSSPLSLLVVTPHEGAFAAVVSRLHEVVATARAALAPTAGDWWLPAFSHAETDRGPGAVRRAGLSMLFEPGVADLSRVNGAGYLYLGGLEQRSRIWFDGVSLQLASATFARLEATEDEPEALFDGSFSGSFVGISTQPIWGCVYDPPKARPFIYLLTHKASGLPLAIGQVGVVRGPVRGWTTCR